MRMYVTRGEDSNDSNEAEAQKDKNEARTNNDHFVLMIHAVYLGTGSCSKAGGGGLSEGVLNFGWKLIRPT